MFTKYRLNNRRSLDLVHLAMLGVSGDIAKMPQVPLEIWVENKHFRGIYGRFDGLQSLVLDFFGSPCNTSHFLRIRGDYISH